MRKKIVFIIPLLLVVLALVFTQLVAAQQWSGGTSSPVPPPVLLSPEDGAVITSPTVNLRWENILPADFFELQVDDTPGFSSPEVYLQNLTVREYGLSMNPGTWYWRMRLSRQTPGYPIRAWSDWSPYRSFTVSAGGKIATSIGIEQTERTGNVFVGDRFSVRAVLVDGHGNPIPNKSIRWTAQNAIPREIETTTGTSGEVKTEFTTTSPGTLTIRAEFSGDAAYEPSVGLLDVSVEPLSSLTSLLSNTAFTLGLPDISDLIENSINKGEIGAIITIENGEPKVLYRTVPLSVSSGEGRLTLRVRSEKNAVITIISPKDFLSAPVYARLEGTEIVEAKGVENVLDLSDNTVKAMVLEGTHGVQLFVSIPPLPDESEIIFQWGGNWGLPLLFIIVIPLAVAAFVFIWVKMRASRSRAPTSVPYQGPSGSTYVF